MAKKVLQDRRSQRHPRFLRKPLTWAISLLFLGATHTAAHAGSSEAWGVNAVGDVVVGWASTDSGDTHAFLRWTLSSGMTGLGTLRSDNSGSSVASSVNATGDVVVGHADIDGTYSHAYRWTQATGMTDLGTLAGNGQDGYSAALSVNAAGDVVVGFADTDSDSTSSRAFRWTQATGMTDLGTLAGGSGNSSAYGVNAAGDVVVGQADTYSGDTHAFRWTLDSSIMTDLGTLASYGTDGYSVARGVNAVGDVVVGWASTDSGDTHAFRWTLDSGAMTGLGTLAANRIDGNSYAYGVNAAGDVVVGQAYSDSGNRAFRWTSATGMQSIEDWLTANGVKVNASASKTEAAYGVNAAGDVVVGVLENLHAFIATPKGLLDLVEINQGLAGSSGTPARAMQDASLVMHGAHGSPMRWLLTAGKQGFWTTGDWGHSDNQGTGGDLGAGEVGYAHGVSDQVMVKFALGRTYSRQDTVLGGNTQVDGTYIMPEVIGKVSGTPLYATVSAYYNWGDAEITRGYDNAGTREYGRGSADTGTAALRARLDWLDALTYGSTAFTPYTSVTYSHTQVGAYSETGGAFTAHWNSRTESSTDARLGLDAVHRLDNELNLLGRLEGAHRFNATGAAASGDVAGLYGFSLPGQTYKRNWLRAAVGVEGKMGGGTGSLMVNGSTQSDAAKYWLAASYRMDF